MSQIFSAELSQVLSRVKRTGGTYGVPWYLVLGEPLAGKSTVVRNGMNLTFQQPASIDGQYCQYWVANEAVLIEAREPIVGPNKNGELLRALCAELISSRPREPLDGIIVVVSATDVAERAEESLEAHAQQLRSYLIDVNRELMTDIPVYVIVNRYDTLWGFAEVFAWNAERSKEDAWGYSVPPDVPSQSAWPKLEEGIRGLGGRIEATCLARLSSEDGMEQRIRAFQHLVEARVFLERLRDLMKTIAFASAYERAPWIRAIIIGAAVPGVGDRLRAGAARFASMGLYQNPYDPHRSPRPGGLPIHMFMKGIVLPEKELVPLKTRWRDDPVTMIGIIVGVLFILGGLVIRYGLTKH
ncbi:MAG TPA: type VI secretion system protein [Polyangiaceae bacterium]|nr:type VI secretion system protein [Polyangiaceae bacterium]